MLTKIQKIIITRAVIIRMGRDEELTDIMDSYPKLTAEEREEIIAEVTG